MTNIPQLSTEKAPSKLGESSSQTHALRNTVVVIGVACCLYVLIFALVALFTKTSLINNINPYYRIKVLTFHTPAKAKQAATVITRGATTSPGQMSSLPWTPPLSRRTFDDPDRISSQARTVLLDDLAVYPRTQKWPKGEVCYDIPVDSKATKLHAVSDSAIASQVRIKFVAIRMSGNLATVCAPKFPNLHVNPYDDEIATLKPVRLILWATP